MYGYACNILTWNLLVQSGRKFQATTCESKGTQRLYESIIDSSSTKSDPETDPMARTYWLLYKLIMAISIWLSFHSQFIEMIPRDELMNKLIDKQIHWWTNKHMNKWIYWWNRWNRGNDWNWGHDNFRLVNTWSYCGVMEPQKLWTTLIQNGNFGILLIFQIIAPFLFWNISFRFVLFELALSNQSWSWSYSTPNIADSSNIWISFEKVLIFDSFAFISMKSINFEFLINEMIAITIIVSIIIDDYLS
jgi:hypothetical protein